MPSIDAIRSAIRTLLTDPDAFFVERADDLSIRGPLVVVTLVALVGSIATVVQNQHLVSLAEPAFREALNESSENMTSAEIDDAVNLFVQVYTAFTYAFALLGPYVVWFLYGGVFHAISAVFDGDGSFSDTMVAVGWGRVPAVFGSVVTVAVNYYNYEVRGVTLSQDISADGATEAFQQLQPPAEVLLVNTSLSIVFTLWAAYIWVSGLQYARDLSRRGAIYTVAVPVAVSLLLSVQTLTSAL